MIKRLLIYFAIIAISIFSMSSLALADNPAKTSIQCGADAAAQVGGCPTPAPADSANDLSSLVANIIKILSVAVGAIAVVMLIYGGFRYVTSGGSQEAITSARKTITYAIIGLIIVAIAQIIVQFTLNKSNDAVNGTNSASSSGQSQGATCQPTAGTVCPK